MIPLHPLIAERTVDRRSVFGPDFATPLSRNLIAAAVAVGQMPGEPARLLEATRSRGWLHDLFRLRRPTPLADPRLEVLRAISASLVKRPSEIPANLVCAANQAGWSISDLRRLFPAASIGSPA